MKRKKVELPNPLSGTNGQLMVMAAHRYCLGRQSYIVPACITWLRSWWDDFGLGTKRVIVRDTVEALQDGYAGSEYDAGEWKRFAVWAYEQMDEESRAWCKSAVAHREKEWPLN